MNTIYRRRKKTRRIPTQRIFFQQLHAHIGWHNFSLLMWIFSTLFLLYSLCQQSSEHLLRLSTIFFLHQNIPFIVWVLCFLTKFSQFSRLLHISLLLYLSFLSVFTISLRFSAFGVRNLSHSWRLFAQCIFRNGPFEAAHCVRSLFRTCHLTENKNHLECNDLMFVHFYIAASFVSMTQNLQF